MVEVKLPSGAKLLVCAAPFKDSRDLYQAVLEEMKSLKIDPKAEVDVNLFKDIFCTLLPSKKVEDKLNICMQRVSYNGLKITDDTFEPVEAREDYLSVCYEVAKENVLPFMKSLFAKYSEILAKVKSSLA